MKIITMKVFTFFLATSFLLSSCNNTPSPADGSIPTEEHKEDANPFSQRYGIASGIIEFKISGATHGTEILYFDSFGRREVSESSLNTGQQGGVAKTFKYVIDDSGFNLNEAEKKGIKIRMPFYSNKDIRDNVGLLNPALLSINGATKVGNEKFLDRDCEKWVNTKDSSELLFWNGIRLRFKKTTMGKESITEAVSIKENASIPGDKFIIPVGYELNDMTIAANAGPKPEGEKEMELKIIGTMNKLKDEGKK